MKGFRFHEINVGFVGTGFAAYVGGDKKLLIVKSVELVSGAIRVPHVVDESRTSKVVNSEYMLFKSTTI